MMRSLLRGETMGLFGDRTAVRLDVEAPGAVVAGDAVCARVSLQGVDRKVQGGRVELLYRNTFQVDDVDSEGDRSTETVTREVVVSSVGLAQDGAVRDGEVRVELPLPRQAPGSADRSVEWLLRAVVDRRHARDATTQAALTVQVPAEPLSAWAERPAQVPPECPVVFEVAQRTLRPGGAVTGQVAFAPTSARRARTLRARLVRERLDQDGNQIREVVAEEVLAHVVELAPGTVRAFTLDLALPRDAQPSFLAANNEQHWFLEAVVDRALAADYVARLELVVHTA